MIKHLSFKTFGIAIVCLFLLTSIQLVEAQNIAPFKDGERVVFVGNSITHGGKYPQIIQLFYQTRFPDMHLKYFNCGIGGNTAAHIASRLSWDVFPHNPTYMTCMTAMNDSWAYIFKDGQQPSQDMLDKCEKAYMASWADIVAQVKAQKVPEVVCFYSTPYDQYSQLDKVPITRLGKNDLLKHLGSRCMDIAKANDWGTVDFYHPFMDIMTEQHKTNPSFSFTSRDRVHPGWMGHTVMAYTFLKAQGMDAVVSSLEIDAKKATVMNAKRCVVSEMEKQKKGLSFRVLEEALPFPDMPYEDECGTFADALKLVPFTEELNQEVLKIAGLKKNKNYTLYIDGDSICTLKGKAWAKGSNLALCPQTPQYKQAVRVRKLLDEQQEIRMTRRWIAKTLLQCIRIEGLTEESPLHLQKAAIEKRIAKAGKQYRKRSREAADIYLKYYNNQEYLLERIDHLYEEMSRAAHPVVHQYEVKMN